VKEMGKIYQKHDRIVSKMAQKAVGIKTKATRCFFITIDDVDT
jgi:hypothetical protein